MSETFAKAKERIIRELTGLGHTVRANLKVPRCEIEGVGTLEIRGQSVHVASKFRTLSVCSDYRKVSAAQLVQWCENMGSLLGDPENG